MVITGGKYRQGPKIAELASSLMPAGSEYHEPFCGAMGTVYRMATLRGDLSWHLSDSNEALVITWNALLAGWVPPDHVTEEQYVELKRKMDIHDPLTGWCGHNLSFGAHWYRTYARGAKTEDYFSQKAKRSTAAKVAAMLAAGVTHVDCMDYRDTSGPGLFYLDPPYASSGGSYYASCKFDHVAFWDYARSLCRSAMVIVTEYEAPDDFVPVHTFGDTKSRPRNLHGKCTASPPVSECIFMHRSQA